MRTNAECKWRDINILLMCIGKEAKGYNIKSQHLKFWVAFYNNIFINLQ